MLASEQASFPIDGVAIRVHRRLTEYADVSVVLRKAHHAVVWNVAEYYAAPSRDVDWALGPTESGGDPLNRHGAGEGWETGRPERSPGLFHRFQTRIWIAGPG